ncbi:hypothetical protein [Chitinimonas naiadis]
MASISRIGAGYTAFSLAPQVANKQDATALQDLKPVTTSGSKSIHVDLSPLARSLSGKGGIAGAGANDDIDKSDLPQQIKDILKRIRQVKKELRELEDKLAQVQANTQLSAEEKKVQTEQLQSQIKSTTASLTTLNDALAKAVKAQKLNPAQSSTVASLMARG